MPRYCLVAFLFSTTVLHADGLLPPSTTGGVEDSVNPQGIFEIQTQTNGSPVSLTTSHSVAGGTFSANMFGQAAFTTLKASSSSMLTSTTSPVDVLAAGFATFTDVVTISSPPFNGQTGLMGLNFNLNGTASQFGSFESTLWVFGQACASFNSSLDCTDPNGLAQSVFSQAPTSGGFPQFFKFIYGRPFDLIFSLSAMNGTFDVAGTKNNLVPTFSTTQPGSGIANASDTLTISQISVFDSQMDPVAGYTVTTGSGTSYPFAGAIPEPSTVLLLATGLLLAGTKLHKRHRLQVVRSPDFASDPEGPVRRSPEPGFPS